MPGRDRWRYQVAVKVDRLAVKVDRFGSFHRARFLAPKAARRRPDRSVPSLAQCASGLRRGQPVQNAPPVRMPLGEAAVTYTEDTSDNPSGAQFTTVSMASILRT